MRKITTLLFIVFYSCGRPQPSTKELKKEFGEFNAGQTIKIIEIDYKNAPVYKKVQEHPKDYTYLDQVKIYKIAYQSDGLFITGLMVTPKEQGKFPCVVFNRTGNREMGKLIVQTAVDMMAPLAAKGYVVIASNYRGNGGSEGKEEFGGKDVNDVANLIGSLSEIKQVDTSRIGLYGISRGGMMNFLILKDHPNIECVVNVGGISNLFTTIKYHPEIKDVCAELIPDFVRQEKETLKARSATFWTDKLPKNVPILLLHGTKDQHVNYQQTVELSNLFDKSGQKYQLVTFENDNHGLINHRNQAFEVIANWFDKYLKVGKSFEEKENRVLIQ